MTNKKRLVESFEAEYNPLSKTLKMNLLLDEQSIRLILQTSASEITTTEGIQRQVLELLERSVYLNLPSGTQAGPHTPKRNGFDK